MTEMDLQSRLREWWDADAATYELSPGHSLSDPRRRQAWRRELARHLPPPPARVLDAGAGTGALSMLAAELGHEVTALDFSDRMLDRARRRAAEAGLSIRFVVADVAEPPPGPFDAVVERHVLWTQPDPVRVLSAWRMVAPQGRLVLYESLRPPTLGRKLRSAAATASRWFLRRPDPHHGVYEDDVLAALPLAGAASFGPILAALGRAGWLRYRIERLRDVERARAGLDIMERLEAARRFAILAE